MKKTFLFFLALIIGISSFGQTMPRKIYLSFNKTVHIIFSSEVKYVDVGLEDILWKKEENMVKLATKTEGFQETSLVVKTKDETIYSFLLQYAPNSDTLIYNIPAGSGLLVKQEGKNEGEIIRNDSILRERKEKEDIEQACKQVLTKKQDIYNVDEMEKNVFVSLTNVFVYKDRLYFHFKVNNNSNINYDVDYFNLTIQGKRKIRSATLQSSNIEPVFTLNNFDRLVAKQTKDIVIVTSKFTVPDNKRLKFEMKETEGGRNFLFTIDKDLIYKIPVLMD
ncbi:MAG: conjugative transposon protein TraN [Bacteroidota bacterium]|nr:conjugative transposon protein TraN [Bacteroidota bacterium]MDP4272648.1 conjugative transposon protein TraN [Bacteroidota bacterium]